MEPCDPPDITKPRYTHWLDREKNMRSALLWFIGVPIPLILLLALCTHHF